jgi:signal transduction histidine kinase
MKIATRLKLTALVSMVMVSILAAALVLAVQRLEQEYRKNGAATEFLKATNQVRYLALDYSVRHDERSTVQWHLRHESLTLLLTTATDFDDAQEQQTLRELMRHHDRIGLLFQQIVANHQERQTVGADRVLLDELEDRLVGQIVNNANVMNTDALLLSEKSRNGLRNALLRAVFVAALAGVLVMVVIVVTSFLTLERVIRPLAGLQEGIAVVGAGNLDFQFAMTRNDELGAFARAFDAMTRRLKATTVSRDDLAAVNERLADELSLRQQTEAELVLSNQALVQSNLDLQRFAQVASHDLQTPLRGIAGFVQLLQKEYSGRLDARADDWLRRVAQATKVLQTLIGDLLEYSRLDARVDGMKPVALEQVFDDALLLLDSAIRDSGALVVRGDLPTLVCDRSQMVQLFHNLVGNALKYCASTPSVRVAAEERDGQWVFSVRDNGIGIEPQHFTRIFDIFARLHNSQKYPGTGIGLAICQRVVQHHGGRIWVESQPGSGSTFLFTIPTQLEASP